MAAALAWILAPIVELAAQQPTAPKVDELAACLRKFEQSYWGYQLEMPVAPSFSYRTLSISSDGSVCVYEYENTGGKAQGKPVRTQSAIYCNGLFYVQACRHSVDGSPDTVWVDARLEDVPLPLKHFSPFAGVSYFDLEHLSDLMTQASQPPAVQSVTDGDSSIWRLEFEVPQKGTYSIDFGRRADGGYVVLGFSALKKTGDRLRLSDYDFVLGTPWSQENPKQVQAWQWARCKWIRWIVSDIRYDDEMRPISVVSQLTTSEEPNHKPQEWSFEKATKLSKPLDPSRVTFRRFELPERISVNVFGSGVPHELRDGKLVALINGGAVDAAQGASFRKPGFWRSRGYYFVLVAILIVVVAVFWRLRGRNSS